MAAVLLIFAFISLLTAFFLFDKILKFQYENYRSEWEKDGKASGFFWNAPESKIFSGSLARSISILSWTFGNNLWMKNEPQIVRTALLMRLSTFLFWVLGFFLFIFASLQ